jgi:hypothetical protein
VNVTFHELAGLAIAQETAAHLGPPDGAGRGARAAAWAVAFGLGVLSHGILDALPHYYPLKGIEDAIGALALVAVWLWRAPRWMKLPLLAVCLAAVLPDAIDLLPADLNRDFGWHLPADHRVFPWHWRAGSGSWRGRWGPDWRVSLTNHLIVLAFCGTALVRTRAVLSQKER